MKILKKSHQLVRQNENKERKPHKHDVNLQKNSTLYFQIGLIVCLLATYGLLEMRFKSKNIPIEEYVYLDDETPEIMIEDFKIYEKEAIKKEPEPDKKVFLPDDPTVVPDDTVIKDGFDDVITEPKPSSEPPIAPSSVEVFVPEEPDDVPFYKIEQAPIYPGCENKKTNIERKKCMSDKIIKLVQKKFNVDLAQEYGLTGVQKIDVQFKIDKTGSVTDIKTRAPHPKLEIEAQRVVEKIPQMTPGKQSNKNVSVIYNLPIKFQVQD